MRVCLHEDRNDQVRGKTGCKRRGMVPDGIQCSRVGQDLPALALTY